MKKTDQKTIALLLLILFIAITLNAQKPSAPRPKIGLCLSGGAAKGIAHISLLKAIDSLGIPISYISGTSMGSIMGGLYASGYSGKELEHLVVATDWEKILSNKTTLDDINIGKKGEYGRYLVQFPMRKGKIELPLGLNEGQNLMALLQKLTLPVAHIRDFNQLPIPFRCMTADIVSGNPIVLDKGDLAMAMRASMSIPTVFMPVDWGGDSLMVDGGLSHNFPVDVVRDMGSDIIIGGYTGGDLYSKKQLNSFLRLTYQSASYNRVSDSRYQQSLCNVLLKFDDALNKAGLTLSDFSKGREIIAVADGVVKDFLPQLQALADAQKAFTTNNIKPLTPPQYPTEFCVDTISFTGLPDEQKDAALRTSALLERHFITPQQIAEGVRNLYGNDQFRSVYYEILGDTNHARLLFHVQQKPAMLLKLGLHYDNQLGSGIIVNWSARFGKHSRILVIADIAEAPKLRVRYQRQLKQSHWSFNVTETYEQTLESFLFEQQQLDNYRRRQNQLAAYLSRSLGHAADFGVGASWNITSHSPLYAIDDKIYINQARPDSSKQLSKVNTSILAAMMFFRYNTLDAPFVPKSGVLLNLDAKFGFFNDALQETISTFSRNDSVSIVEKFDTTIAPFTRLALSFTAAIPLSKQVSLTTKIYAGALFGNKFTETGKLYGEDFLIGGIERRQSPNYFPFAGNREGYTRHTAFATAQLGCQIEVLKNLYVQPQAAVLASDNYAVAWSGGATVSYQTQFMPILFSISKASNNNRWQPYFAVGFRF
ncbi:MAG: patatin-like phospholipase family protein [Saprospiraceae bacterium]|nr:patatin-like phospholipase family protein [Saprospiraceae bacterium]